jgi:hypothetical protein
MEAVGEILVDLLGLEDSLFQDVYDNMTEEELDYAIAVNRKREAEYKEWEARKALGSGPDLEGGEAEMDIKSQIQGGEIEMDIKSPIQTSNSSISPSYIHVNLDEKLDETKN